MNWPLIILIVIAAVLLFSSWCVGGATEDPRQAEGGDALRRPVQRKYRDAPDLRLVRTLPSDENQGDC